jgi:hypothetical protein
MQSVRHCSHATIHAMQLSMEVLCFCRIRHDSD